MAKHLLRLTSLCLILGLVAFYVFNQPPKNSALAEEASAAYNAGDYQKALPLFKELAASKEVRASKDLQNAVYSRIVEIESRLAAASAPATSPASPSAQVASAPATSTGDPAVDQANIMNQALSFALSTMVNPADPPTGADRVLHKPAKPGEVVEMRIKELGNFEFNGDTDTTVPADVKALDGAHLKLTGFMMPLDQAEKPERFALVPSLQNCCFGKPPGVQHIITCQTPVKKGTEFSVDEIEVEGVLHVNIRREANYTYSIFELEVTSAKAKE